MRDLGIYGTSLLLSLLFLCGLVRMADAQFYKYVDDNGVVHLTNVPTEPNYEKIESPLVTVTKGPNWIKIRPTRRALKLEVKQKELGCYDEHITKSCKRYGIDYNLVKAVIRAESAFDPYAISPKGAVGLMQLMPDTSRYLGVSDPFDPIQNIDGGTRYLRELLDRFKNNVVLALAAYNAGPEAVQEHGGIPPFDETRMYVRRVLDFYTRYVR